MAPQHIVKPEGDLLGPDCSRCGKPGQRFGRRCPQCGKRCWRPRLLRPPVKY